MKLKDIKAAATPRTDCDLLDEYWRTDAEPDVALLLHHRAALIEMVEERGALLREVYTAYFAPPMNAIPTDAHGYKKTCEQLHPVAIRIAALLEKTE